MSEISMKNPEEYKKMVSYWFKKSNLNLRLSKLFRVIFWLNGISAFTIGLYLYSTMVAGGTFFIGILVLVYSLWGFWANINIFKSRADSKIDGSFNLELQKSEKDLSNQIQESCKTYGFDEFDSIKYSQFFVNPHYFIDFNGKITAYLPKFWLDTDLNEITRAFLVNDFLIRTKNKVKVDSYTTEFINVFFDRGIFLLFFVILINVFFFSPFNSELQYQLWMIFVIQSLLRNFFKIASENFSQKSSLLMLASTFGISQMSEFFSLLIFKMEKIYENFLSNPLEVSTKTAPVLGKISMIKKWERKSPDYAKIQLTSGDPKDTIIESGENKEK